MLQLVQTLAGMGIDQASIEPAGASVYLLYPLVPPQAGQHQPTGLSIAPQTVHPGVSGELQPTVGYCVSSLVRVSLHDSSRSGEVLDAIVSAGANFGINISFRVRDEGAARRAVLEAAGKDAQAKAQVLAAAVGKKIGDPLIVIGDTFLLGQGGGLMSREQTVQQGLVGPLAGVRLSTASVSPNELIFVARVQITYQLR